jgi:KIAA1430-like protein
LTTERQKKIDYENRLLLGKISGIFLRDGAEGTKGQKKKPRPAKKSLHDGYRRKEQERIARENEVNAFLFSCG